MKDNTNTEANADNMERKSREIGLVITIIIISLVAFAGAGLSAYEFIDSSKKDEQIQSLQNKIKELEKEVSVATNGKPRIRVVSSSWSGWSKDYKPVEKESFCEIKLYEKCVVTTRHYSDTSGMEWDEEILSFEVRSVDDDKISIHTFQDFSYDGSGLGNTKRDFVIEAGESLRLTTPTMDEGDIFTLSLTEE
ncbi:MAG: hypothetical protein K6C34_00720 [Alphaproteobacteria bacterium]|nr:hypothetical protein [Alphaproteobacteria bacterium]